MTTLQVLQYGLNLTLDGYRQLSFIKSWLKPLVNRHCDSLWYSFNESERKKVLFYYPMYTVLACAQMYLTLKGRNLTKDETKRLTLVGAMATLCDDLIDEDSWTRNEIFLLLSQNIKKEVLPTKAKLLLALNEELKAFWDPTEKYITQLKVALEWQATSGKQLNPNITLEEIVHVCREKNGHTSLMFASLLDETWTKQELDFIYQSAIVGQLTNDSFDMYFDTQNGIYTYFNKAESIEQVRNFFLGECHVLHSMVRACDTSDKNKQNTIRRMSILHAFTLTALDQFKQTENKYGRPINWKTVPRKDMVIDMAKNSNRWKTVKYMKWLSDI
jgi:hypothetical protein